jgi:chorismate mutase
MDEELLKHYRDQIDTIDWEIVYLLSRRFEIVRQIWKIKKEHWVEALQTSRFELLLEELLVDAKERMVDQDLIKNIWNLIHEESLRLEK